MRMMHPDDPHTMRFPRTAREAFGTNFYEEKPNRDVLWFIGAVILIVVLAAVLIHFRVR